MARIGGVRVGSRREEKLDNLVVEALVLERAGWAHHAKSTYNSHHHRARRRGWIVKETCSVC